MAKSRIRNGQIPNDQIPNLCLQLAIGRPSAFQCCDKKCCTDLEREGETCHKVSAHVQVVSTFGKYQFWQLIVGFFFLQPLYNSKMGSSNEWNEFPWDAGKERKGHFPPSKFWTMSQTAEWILVQRISALRYFQWKITSPLILKTGESRDVWKKYTKDIDSSPCRPNCGMFSILSPGQFLLRPNFRECLAIVFVHFLFLLIS